MTDSNAPFDRDVDRALRSWLHEDRHEDASRIAGAVLDQVDTTRQRRATWWPVRRTPTMNKFVGLAAGAAAVVAVAFVGLNLLPGTGSSTVGAQPSASPSVAPIASPQPTLAAIPRSGAIDAGTYLMTDGVTSFSVTIPSGWDAGGDDIRKHRDQPNEVIFGLYTPAISVWPDACATEDAPPPTGPTVDDLVAALRAQENSDISEPSELITDGSPGVRVDVSIPAGLDVATCHPGFLRIWVDDTGSYLAGLGPTGTAPVTIVGAPSGRMVYYTSHEAQAEAADMHELDAIVDSIQFVPAP